MEEVIFRFIYSGRNPSSFFIKDIKVSVPPYEPVKGIYEALMKKGPLLGRNLQGNSEARLWDKEWTNKMIKVVKHYEDGGLMDNRP